MKEFSLETRIRVLMNQYDFHFQKSLGQNFLIDEGALSQIVAGADVTKEDKVLEIGPGMGFLTEKLADAAGLVMTVELDGTLCEILTKLFSEEDNVVICHGDALRLDFASMAAEGEARGFEHPFKIVANLPYYITTPLIFYFLEYREYWSEMVLMVQKEVAQRIVATAATKDYGVLTLMVQYDADSEVIFEVPASSFHPRPAVDSAVIRLTKRREPPCPVNDRKKFQSLVKAGFGQRRKTLSNALANGGLGLSKERVCALLTACGIDGKRRGETLSFEEYALLANHWASDLFS